MDNYRKAKKGEIDCEHCGFYQKARLGGTVGRCKKNLARNFWYAPAVGKHNTCNSAFKQDDQELISSTK